MANKYIAPYGNDTTGDGSIGNPWLTFSKGIQNIVAGDTLFSRQNLDGSPGIYPEKISSVPSGTSWLNKVTISNYPGEKVILRPTSGRKCLSLFSANVKFVQFDGLNYDGTQLSDYEGCIDLFGSVSGDVSDIRVWNGECSGKGRSQSFGCIFAGSSGGGAGLGFGANLHFNNLKVHGGGQNQLDHAFYLTGNGAIVENSEIFDFTGAGIQFYNGSGQPTGCIARRNYIHNPASTLNAHWGIIDAGINSEVYYNVIWSIQSNGNQGKGIQAFGSTSGTYDNNTISLCATGLNLVDSANAKVRNNISYNNTTNYEKSGDTGTTETTNLIGIDPKFVSSATFNFQLLTTSPAINTGTALGYTTDILGIAVPQQANPCIGCYEFVPTVPTPTPPAAPSSLSATTISSSQINLAWINNGAGTLVFSIERRVGNNAFVQIVVTAAGATSYSNTGLAQNTTYEYRIRAFDGSLYSLYSSSAGATTSINFPATPTTLLATTISSTEIDLSWVNPGSGTLVFAIERRIGTNAFVEIFRTAAGATSYANTGLGSDTTYEYRVRAYDGSFFSPYSNTSSATTSAAPPTPPPPPSPPPTATNVRWQVVFSKPVSGVNAAQFELSGTPINSTIKSVVPQFSGPYGTTFIVTVQLGPGTGTLGLNLKATGSIKDKAGNVLTVPFPGQTYVITV